MLLDMLCGMSWPLTLNSTTITLITDQTDSVSAALGFNFLKCLIAHKHTSLKNGLTFKIFCIKCFLFLICKIQSMIMFTIILMDDWLSNSIPDITWQLELKLLMPSYLLSRLTISLTPQPRVLRGHRWKQQSVKSTYAVMSYRHRVVGSERGSPCVSKDKLHRGWNIAFK